MWISKISRISSTHGTREEDSARKRDQRTDSVEGAQRGMQEPLFGLISTCIHVHVSPDMRRLIDEGGPVKQN
jgi:hypothetical protein